MKGKIFTPEEATKMLPLVRSVVSDIRAAARLVDRLQKEFALEELARSVLKDVALPSTPTEKKIARLSDHMRTLENELESIGWFLVDAVEGIVKCYSERESRIIYLSWAIGEPRVGYWFPLKQTHLDRRPLLDDEKIAENQSGR